MMIFDQKEKQTNKLKINKSTRNIPKKGNKNDHFDKEKQKKSTPPCLASSSMLFPPPILDVHIPFEHCILELPSYGVLMEWMELALMENVVM
jgi:hypothetical protein